MGLFFKSKEDKLWDRANKFLINEDYDTAIRISTECISQYPKCIEAYRVRGVAYKGKKDYDRAIADLTHVIELETEKKTPFGIGYRYYIRSLVYSDMGDYERAIADLTQSLKLDPNHCAREAAQKALAIAKAKLGKT